MLESLPVSITIGTLMGFLAGLGVGGGSLLILWLTMVLDMSQEAARSINLLFFLPAAIITSLFRWRQGKLEFRRILPAQLAGIASAILFTSLARNLDTELLQKYFGFLLLITGLRELFYRPRNAK